MNVACKHNSIRVKGPGRPQTKNSPTQLTLYLDKEIKDALRSMSEKHNLSISEIVESLVLKELNGDSYLLDLSERNKQLERRLKEVQKENEKLKKRLESLMNKKAKRKDSLEKIQERIEEVFKKKDKNVKVVDIVRAVYALPAGDPRIKEKTEKFLNEYFERRDGKLISEALGLEIEEDFQYQPVGWKVKKK
ncbi:MAG: hypothetical protein J7J22_05775 [Candidatus Verstraetearchaeota archaeon]|nr:hypothetical protein [Candidatus Verstraetearchaeota archaeon]